MGYSRHFFRYFLRVHFDCILLSISRKWRYLLTFVSITFFQFQFWTNAGVFLAMSANALVPRDPRPTFHALSFTISNHMAVSRSQASFSTRILSDLNHDRLVDLAEDKITGIDTWLYELNDFIRSGDKFELSSDALVQVILDLESIAKKVLHMRNSCDISRNSST